MRRIGFLALLTLSLLACQKADEHAGHTATTATEATTTTPPPSNPALDPKRESGPLATFGNGASGYLSVPTTGPAKKPAIIVIQEWWGVDEWIRSQTDRFAQQGYVALAVDLYRGKSTKSMEEAHELSRGLPED